MRQTDPLRRDIPVYALYGEADALLVPRGVHAETISSRSKPLDWRIAPHRHSAMHQALLITQGRASATVEGRRVTLPAPSLAWVPPLCVHAYDFSPATVGIVVSMPSSELTSALRASPAVLERLSRFSAVAGPLPAEDWDEVEALARALLADYQAIAPGRETSLAARAALLAVWTARRIESAEGPASRDGPALAAVRRFLDRVEASYAAPLALSTYAREVGVSLSHLNRMCRTVTGRSPSRLIQDRRLVEAKRFLTYTAVPVAQVAYRLGFADAAYFSRFFRMRTGVGPLAFRRLADSP